EGLDAQPGGRRAVRPHGPRGSRQGRVWLSFRALRILARGAAWRRAALGRLWREPDDRWAVRERPSDRRPISDRIGGARHYPAAIALLQAWHPVWTDGHGQAIPQERPDRLL